MAREGLLEEAITLFEECFDFEVEEYIEFEPEEESSLGRLGMGRLQGLDFDRIPTGKTIKVSNIFYNFKKSQAVFLTLDERGLAAYFSQDPTLLFWHLLMIGKVIVGNISIEFTVPEVCTPAYHRAWSYSDQRDRTVCATVVLGVVPPKPRRSRPGFFPDRLA